jgi:hypothetical protein
VLKAMGIAFAAGRLFPGPREEVARQLQSLPSGQAICGYFAAIEIAVPFLDTARGPGFLRQVFDREGASQSAVLAGQISQRSVGETTAVMPGLLDVLETLVTEATDYAGPRSR